MERLSGLEEQPAISQLSSIIGEDSLERRTRQSAETVFIDAELIDTTDDGMESRSVKRTMTFKALLIEVAPVFIHALFPDKETVYLRKTVERIAPIIVSHPLFLRLSSEVGRQMRVRSHSSSLELFVRGLKTALKEGKGKGIQLRFLQMMIFSAREAYNGEKNLITDLADVIVDYLFEAKESFRLNNGTFFNSDPFIGFLVKDFKHVNDLLSGYWTRKAIKFGADHYKGIPEWVFKYVDIHSLIRSQISAFIFKSLFHYTGSEKIGADDQEQLIEDCNFLADTLFRIVDLYLAHAKNNHEVISLFHEIAKVVFGKSNSKKETRNRILYVMVLALENIQNIPRMNKAVNEALEVATKTFMV